MEAVELGVLVSVAVVDEILVLVTLVSVAVTEAEVVVAVAAVVHSAT